MDNLEKIYTDYYKVVYRYILALSHNEALAEDVTQETFLKVLKDIDTFRGDCKLDVWLCQIAKNMYYTIYKRNKRFALEENDPASLSQSIEIMFENRDTAFRVLKALHKIDEPYKEVFSLRFFGELPFTQIAELFEKTESWARVTYHRAKIKIREAYNG